MLNPRQFSIGAVLVCGLLACSPPVADGQVQRPDAGANSDAGVDAGTDSGAQDSGVLPDAGAVLDAGTEPDAGSDFPLPVFRLDLRSVSGGTFAQALSGVLELPASFAAALPTAEFWSHGYLGGPAASAVVSVDGGTATLDFVTTVDTVTSAPASTRELVSAHLPGTGVRFLGVLDASGGTYRLRLDSRTTALQALALSEVPPVEQIPLILAFGAAPGDRPDLDARVATVAAAIDASLAAGSGSGVDFGGFPLVGGPVFSAVEAGSPTGPRPALGGVVGAGRLAVIEQLVPGADVAFWVEGHGASPSVRVPPGVTRFGFFAETYFTSAIGQRLVARQAVGGVTGPASALATVEPEPQAAPVAPTLTEVPSSSGSGLRVTGVQPGNWVLFMNGPVGFGALKVPDDASEVFLEAARLPPAGGVFRAYQVTADWRMSTGSNGVVL